MGKHNGKARKAGLKVGSALVNRHSKVLLTAVQGPSSYTLLLGASPPFEAR